MFVIDERFLDMYIKKDIFLNIVFNVLKLLNPSLNFCYMGIGKYIYT